MAKQRYVTRRAVVKTHKLLFLPLTAVPPVAAGDVFSKAKCAAKLELC